MADNTQLNTGSGGDTIRDKDRSGIKTQIVGLDVNIGGSEVLMTLGQQAMASSIPVVIANNQSALFLSAHQSTNVDQWNGNTVDTNSGTKSAGTLRVVLATDQPQLTNKLLVTPDANSAVNLAQVGGASTQTGHGTASGCQRVEIANDGTGLVNAVQNGTWTVQPGNTANTTPWLVTQSPASSGGPSTSRIKAAASTNSTSVKGSAGQVYGWYLYNNTSSAKFFKLYNKATAPTIGTDTPFCTIGIPPNGGCVIEFSMGLALGTGIGYGITGAIGDSDTTATAADDVHGILLYK
jgi:hypothetical protein